MKKYCVQIYIIFVSMENLCAKKESFKAQFSEWSLLL